MSNKFLELSTSPLMNLDHTKRYSGTKLVEEETLSQHIVDTIMMGLKIIDNINNIEQSVAYQLDPALYVMKAIHHDLEECITGDIPRPLKYYNESTLTSLREVADNVAEEFFEKEFHNSHSHYELWSNSKEGSEGFILKIVDNLVVAHKVVKEVLILHNYYMLRVAHEVVHYTKELRDYLDKDNLEEIFLSDKAREYLRDILTDSIEVMENLIRDNQSAVDICKSSMI